MKVWSRILRSEGVTPKETEEDAAEVQARAAFGACVSAINAVDSLSYRFAEVRFGRSVVPTEACALNNNIVYVSLRDLRDWPACLLFDRSDTAFCSSCVRS